MGTGSEVDELAVLRRRAYGPDADIAADPVASARLRQLETLARGRSSADTPSAARAPTESQAADGVSPGAARDAGEGRPAEHAEDTGTAETGTAENTGTADGAGSADDAEPGTSRSPRLRALVADRRTWITGGVGAVVGAALVAGLTLYPWNAPDQVLRVDPDPAPVLTQDAGWLDGLGIDRESARIFESVRGFTPWTVELKDGGRCMVLSETEGSGVLNMACTGAGLDPTLDVLPAMWGLSRGPAGGAIRFVARGDTVEVWFSGVQPTTDSARATPIS